MREQSARNGPESLRRSLRDDESGMALVYVTMALPVIIGFALLAIDVGRYTTLNSSLQHGADALALAGAAELDGGVTSISRSEEAMKQFITQNTATFTSSTASINWADVTTCYLSSIPAKDSDPIPSADCLDKAAANSSYNARFVQVVVEPKTYTTIFPASFIGALSNTSQTAAEAVAGFQMAACNFAPVYICNPFEPSGTSAADTFNDFGLIAASKDPQQRKSAIKLIEAATNTTATAVPGQFGYLDPAFGKGKKALGEEIASVAPDICYITNSLSTVKTGGMTSLVKAFNTRFDMYGGPYQKGDYPPAANVRKGWDVNGACGGGFSSDSTQFMAMPVDSCFKTNTCASGNRGNGDWGWDPESGRDVSFSEYWNVNFNHNKNWSADEPLPSESDLVAAGANGYANPSATPFTGNRGSGKSDTPPRYDVYLRESKEWLSTDPQYNSDYNPLSKAQSVGKETGIAQCGVGIKNPDRRIIYGAIINCNAQNLTPGNGGYQAFAFGKFFMIRPMSDPPNATMYVELVDVARPGDGSGVVRDMVQLYR